jgi:inositol transport system substrate-binding protein
MKKVVSVLLLLGILFAGTACGGANTEVSPSAADTTTTASQDTENEVYKIGYSNRLDSDTFLKDLRDGFEAMASADATLEVVFADADNDSQKQLEQVDNFLVQGVDCLILCPNDGASIISAVEQANERNVPVICFSQKAKGGEFYFVGVSDYDCGKMQGEYMAKVLPENAKIVYLGGNSGYQTSIDRKDGFYEGLGDRINDIEVLSEQECMYTRDEGMTITEDWIQTFPQFDGLVAVAGEPALGALQALIGAQRLDGVIISSIDALPEELVAIKNGQIAQSVRQDKEGQVQALYDVVKQLQAGKTPDENTLVPLINVTKDNVDQYID